MYGPNTFWPIIGQSKRQDAVSTSTPEAEMAAGSYALKQRGLPFMDIVDAIQGKKSTLHVMEDNDAMIRVCTTGRNPTMRHIGRCHGISIAIPGEDQPTPLLSH